MQNKLFVTNIIKGFYRRLSPDAANSQSKADLTWWKTKYLKHIPAGKIRSYDYKRNKIFYSRPLELLHTLKEIFVHEIYKIELPVAPYIIDCGANIGLSIIYLKEQFPAAEVLAFEPDESNFQLLKTNIRSFNFANVHARNEAVWIEDTTLQFTNDGTMGSKIETKPTQNTREVQAVKLAKFLSRRVDFLKIDIEGAEYEVLKDAQDDLKNVQNMFLEYHGHFSQNNQLTDLFNIINKAGFNYYIKEAAEIYKSPFLAAHKKRETDFDVQLNIFCFRKNNLAS